MKERIPPSLGTELRRLIELLDGDLERHYHSLGLKYRPRYTPIVRALGALGPSSIKSIAHFTGLTHSATSQTVAQMEKDGLLDRSEGKDGRERIAQPTPQLLEMLPTLEVQWAATSRAAVKLDSELSVSIMRAVSEATTALQRRTFAERIAAERLGCFPGIV